MEKTVLQTQYDQLVEEKIAFQEAGMDAKVAEWDHKIRLCEASMRYPLITFAEMSRNLGIESLKKAVQERNLRMASEIEKAKDLARDILGPTRTSRISESKLWSIIHENDYRFVGNPLAKIEAMKMLVPKLSGTARNMLMYTLSETEKTAAEDQVSPMIEAYIKVVGIESYKENDNPPMDVLRQIAEAVKSNLFTALFVAFPMLGPVKQVDPIVFGLVSDHKRKLWGMDEEALLRFNRDVSVEDLEGLAFGNLFRITEWV